MVAVEVLAADRVVVLVLAPEPASEREPDCVYPDGTAGRRPHHFQASHFQEGHRLWAEYGVAVADHPELAQPSCFEPCAPSFHI